MTNLTNSNERLLHLRARKQAIRDLVARVTSAFGAQGAHDLLLEAATDIEEMIESGASAPSPAAAPSSPHAPPAAAPAPAKAAAAPKRAPAKAAPAAPARAAAGGGGQKRPIASLLLGVLKSAAPRPLAGAEIFDELNKVRPNTKLGQVFKTLTRLAGLPGTTLVRKGVEGKFRYTVRVAGDSAAPASAKETSAKETAAKDTGAKRAPAKEVRATKGNAEPAPAKTNNALVLEALAKVGPTTDAAPLAQVAFGVVTADTKRKVRNALNSLLSSRKIKRREDKTWEPLSA